MMGVATERVREPPSSIGRGRRTSVINVKWFPGRGHSVKKLVYIFAGILGAFLLCSSSTIDANSVHYQIGAWYFLGWSSSNQGTLAKSARKLYGASDTWGGVRDYASGAGAFEIEGNEARINFADRVPYLGYYDESRQSVVDSQIKVAYEGGINFFAFYWYINPITGEETSVDAPLHRFFSSQRHELKYVVAPINGGSPTGHMSQEVWQRQTIPLIINYMRSPLYYRIDGRPLLVDFQFPFENSNGRRQAYLALRKASLKALGVTPLILYVLSGRNTLSDAEYQKKHSEPDGFTCFNVGTYVPSESATQLLERWRSITLSQINGAAKDYVYVPCATTGVDARPWFGLGWGNPKSSKDIEHRPYVKDMTPKLLEQELFEVKSLLDSSGFRSFSTTIIYSWNEWGEATAVLEPSKVSGSGYLNSVHAVFGSYAK
jgi:hypothetical protein